MNIEILDEMTKDELVEYCVALNDCLYTCEKVNELRNDIIEEQGKLAKYNESLYERFIEHFSNTIRLDVIEEDLRKKYRGHIKPAKVKPYRQSDKLDVEVMDLNNEPEKEQIPDFVEGDIVWIQALEGRWQILSNANSFVGSDGTKLFYYQ